jgi:hypothetical protein
MPVLKVEKVPRKDKKNSKCPEMIKPLIVLASGRSQRYSMIEIEG